MRIGFLKGSSVVRKDFLIVLILLINAFAWFFMNPMMLNRIMSGVNIKYAQNLVIWAAYYAGKAYHSSRKTIVSLK